MTNTAKHTTKAYPLAIGQYVSLKSLGADQWNTFLILRCDLEGNFYGKQSREFACGEELITQNDVLETTGQHHDVAYLESENNRFLKAAIAKATHQ